LPKLFVVMSMTNKLSILIYLVLGLMLNFSALAQEPGFNNLQESTQTSDEANPSQIEEEGSSETGSEPRIYRSSVKKKALLVRAGKLAIPPTAQIAARKVKELFRASPGTQETVDHFTAKYLVDEQSTVSKLESMGYEVEKVYSSDFESGREYKNHLKGLVEDERTEVLVFFGHGDKANGVALYYPSEYAFQDPTDLEAISGGGLPGSDKANLSARDLKNWLGERKLKGLILMSCNGAYQTYIHKHTIPGKRATSNPRWDEVVGEDGFFAGFATYSLYFDPRTPRILEAMEEHFDEGEDKGIYYIRTGPFLRKISLLGGLDDGQRYYDVLKNDEKVHVHDEQVDGLTSSLVNLVTAVQSKDVSLRDSIEHFLLEHQDFLKEEHIGNEHNDGSFSGELSQNPTAREITDYINAHAKSVITVALKAVSPDLFLPQRIRVKLYDSNPQKISLDARLQIRRGRGLDRLVKLLSSKVGSVEGIDKDVLKENLSTLSSNFPGLDLDFKMDLKKKVNGSTVSFEPIITGYRIYLGDNTGALPGQRSPYEIHAQVSALNRFVSRAMEDQFSQRQQVFHQDLRVTDISGSIKLHRFHGLNQNYKDRNHFDISAQWEFEIDWPVIGKRYAYATTIVQIKRELLQETNTFKLTPKVTLKLDRGWTPKVRFGQSLLDRAVRWVLGKGIQATFHFFEDKFNQMIHAEIGRFIPDDPRTGNRQKLVLDNVHGDSTSIEGQFKGMIFDLDMVMPGGKMDELVTSRIKIVDLYSTKDRISCLIELK